MKLPSKNSSLPREKDPLEPFSVKKTTISKKIKNPAQKESFTSKTRMIQKKSQQNTQEENRCQNEAGLDETHIYPLEIRTNLKTSPQQFKHIEDIVDKRFQKNWQDLMEQKIKKDLQELILKELRLIFQNDFKQTFRTKGLEAINAAVEKICAKIIPDLAQTIIKKNEKELKK